MYGKGVEIFVIDGVLEDEQGSYPKHTWLRDAPGSKHRFKTLDGCVFYLKTGHGR